MDAHCHQLFKNCKPAAWAELVQDTSKQSQRQLECGLNELRENKLADTMVAAMLHMPQVVNHLIETAPKSSIQDIKAAIQTSIETLDYYQTISPNKDVFETFSDLNIPMIEVGFSLMGQDVSLRGTAEFLRTSKAQSELAKQLTKLLNPFKKSKTMRIINGIDLNLWFSDNKEDRLAHKRQITSELIEKSIREFQTQSSKVDASNQIKAGLSGLISELNQLLRIQDLHILREKIAGLNNHS